MNEKAGLRSRVYAALSVAFSRPCEGLAAPGAPQAAVLILREATRALEIVIPESVLANIEGGAAHEMSNSPLERREDELEVEYNRLFVGPGAPRVYPYESLYRDSTGLVMGPSAGEVLQAYRRAGLAINTAFKDLPDHVAVELEFMAHVCWGEARAISAGDADRVLCLKQQQRSFLDAHLASWLPAMCEKVIRETTSTIYRGFAEIAAIFVGWDRERLDAEQLSGVEAGA
ncbi:MAG: putative component of anaerobic dehydrogenase [candidate division NC10 bacterium]|nr:putative component of anaerobic dehydrogenase [candidate division NC10 bacterium]